MIFSQPRDPRFITIRRGGTLSEANHHLLAIWAAKCAEHVLPLFEASSLDKFFETAEGKNSKIVWFQFDFIRIKEEKILCLALSRQAQYPSSPPASREETVTLK